MRPTLMVSLLRFNRFVKPKSPTFTCSSSSSSSVHGVGLCEAKANHLDLQQRATLPPHWTAKGQSLGLDVEFWALTLTLNQGQT
jgi:hypothetical protein